MELQQSHTMPMSVCCFSCGFPPASGHQSEFYDIPQHSMANTADRHSTAPMTKHRHRMTTLQRVKRSIRPATTSMSMSRSMASDLTVTTFGPGGDGAEKNFPSPHKQLLHFERGQHQKVNFQDYTKEELIEMIESQNLELPGRMVWDPTHGELRKEICKKQVYVDFCRQKLYELEPKPLMRSGKRLLISNTYCVVSIFRARQGGVRVMAYNNVDSSEYQLVLIHDKISELDMDPPPTTDNTREWVNWSKFLLPRLELTEDGFLRVGPPPLRENGLPQHFSLTGSHDLDPTEANSKAADELVPSRMHVTLFFNHM